MRRVLAGDYGKQRKATDGGMGTVVVCIFNGPIMCPYTHTHGSPQTADRKIL